MSVIPLRLETIDEACKSGRSGQLGLVKGANLIEVRVAPPPLHPNTLGHSNIQVFDLHM